MKNISVLGTLRKAKWLQQYYLLRFNNRLPAKRAKQITETELGNILILIPHADDEWIGCSQLLIHRDIKKKCYYFNFFGEKSNRNNEIIRLKELKMISNLFQFEIECSQGNHFEELSKLFNEQKINSVFFPSFFDWHFEHIKVNKILYDVLSSLRNSEGIAQPQLYMYQVSVPLPTSLMNFYMGMNKKQHKYKWQIFNSIYISQRHLPSYRFKLQERLSAFGLGEYSAEIYSKIDYKNWAAWLNVYIKNENVLSDKFKSQIDNLKVKYNLSNQIFSELRVKVGNKVT